MVFDNTVRGWDGIRRFRVMGWDGNWWDGKCDGMGELMPWRGGRQDGAMLWCTELLPACKLISYFFNSRPSS